LGNGFWNLAKFDLLSQLSCLGRPRLCRICSALLGPNSCVHWTIRSTSVMCAFVQRTLRSWVTRVDTRCVRWPIRSITVRVRPDIASLLSDPGGRSLCLLENRSVRCRYTSNIMSYWGGRPSFSPEIRLNLPDSKHVFSCSDIDLKVIFFSKKNISVQYKRNNDI